MMLENKREPEAPQEVWDRLKGAIKNALMGASALALAAGTAMASPTADGTAASEEKQPSVVERVMSIRQHLAGRGGPASPGTERASQSTLGGWNDHWNNQWNDHFDNHWTNWTNHDNHWANHWSNHRR
jgi:hypothetical protein